MSEREFYEDGDDYDPDEWDDQSVYGPSTVIAALDRIEDLARTARTVPLSAAVMLNRAEILDLLDQAREALPDDLKAADAVVADADAVLGRADSAAEVTIAEANSRARATLDDAREKADQLLRDANEQAEDILARAHNEAERLTVDAQAQADATIADATAEAERLVSSENITVMAEDRARQIIGDARRSDAQLRTGADDYASKCLTELSTLLADLQRRTDAGRRTIAERSGRGRTDIDLGQE
ncbi:MAG: hypothetical protein Q4C87_12480 [Actinomycetaceae bacterium]|nr:hypothetical protein [Actinomycetaceae bacterium]